MCPFEPVQMNIAVMKAPEWPAMAGFADRPDRIGARAGEPPGFLAGPTAT